MKLSYFSITNIVWSKMALYVLQNIIITPEINSPYSIPPQMWSHSWLYYFWFSSYDRGLLRKAAILDLFNMAATAGIQLGPLKKLVCYGHIYTYSKIGACRTIWTIIWLSPLTNSTYVYASTTSHAEKQINSFYNDVEDTLGKPNRGTIVMGNFNVQVEKITNPMGTATSKFGLDRRNESASMDTIKKVHNLKFQQKEWRR